MLRRHDILLVADEVVCGFGRLGARTGCERFGIALDLATFAKGLTSAYAPLSAVAVSEGFWDVLMSGSREHGMMGHGWTCSGHPLGARWPGWRISTSWSASGRSRTLTVSEAICSGACARALAIIWR
ncbi:adenosylmethionine-8-amino-7-oxononanoate aminotransferase [Paraburkholderia sp. JPY158]|uniref:Adenosylmethionine-8-amino-7-oxononanoate aminotransferase n=2 Tax=Paraburkholderia TaxID=1822464 RepID=A0A7W8P829_9BURK|nr:adenosylmethionine-8-amino-7-oxononanoate aminotransferase [Paraburkholderia youngii]MBB5429229.1 adenosylmethionine-8-amino-7-oxononanoate aminotransferase [Paraburkholderia atlantica]